MGRRAASANSRLGSRRLGQIVVPLVLIVAGPAALVQAASPSAAATARSTPVPAAAAAMPAASAAKAVYFHTLPPGAKLPSGAHCAELVNASPQPEAKPANKRYNSRKGRHVGARFLAEDGPNAQKLPRRPNADFPATTIHLPPRPPSNCG